MRYITLIALLFSPLLSWAQQTEGVATYTRKTDFAKLIAQIKYMTQEQKDRYANTWKNDAEWKEKMKLSFSPSASLYSHEGESGEVEQYNYTFRNSDLFLYRDFDRERVLDVEETLGKTYVVDDSLRLPVWRIGNQVREIAGHMCLNATTTDPVQGYPVMAWFAQDIPVSAGPERYCGLPGLILELDLNNGVVLIEATGVTFKPVAGELKPHKVKKPKVITRSGYEAMIKKHIADREKEQDWPFAGIRY